MFLQIGNPQPSILGMFWTFTLEKLHTAWGQWPRSMVKDAACACALKNTTLNPLDCTSSVFPSTSDWTFFSRRRKFARSVTDIMTDWLIAVADSDWLSAKLSPLITPGIEFRLVLSCRCHGDGNLRWQVAGVGWHTTGPHPVRFRKCYLKNEIGEDNIIKLAPLCWRIRQLFKNGLF